MLFTQYIVFFIELIIIAIMINYFLSFFWNVRSRSMDLMIGVIVFVLIYFLSSWLHFTVLNKILSSVTNIGVIGLLIIFQPELRIAFSKLSLKGRRYREITEFDKFLDDLSYSVYRLADKRIGALIALEHEDSLEEYAQKSVILNANFSPELLESIFVTTTPLHDGAIIIRNLVLVAAAVILPLAEDTPQIAKSMGTRHRAGLGLSQVSDSLVIVVSEESGKVSIARDGIMTRGIKMDRFKGIIRSIFNPQEQKSISRFNIMEWFRR